MSAVTCTFYEKTTYQYENDELLAVTSEMPDSPGELPEMDSFSLQKTLYLEYLDQWVQTLKKQAKDAVVEKLTAELTFEKNGDTEIAFYIIVAFRTEKVVSSYWIRKMKYQDIHNNLMSDAFLGSLIKNFSYIQELPQSEIVAIPDQSPFLMTPECVQYMEEYFTLFDHQQILEEEKTDEDEMMSRMEDGYYVTRILAHSLRRNNLWLYCGTTFEIENGRRKHVFWNAEICLQIVYSLDEKIMCGKIYVSSEKSWVNARKYPWLLVERNEI